MKHSIYSIKDHATLQHHNPFVAATDAEATRMITSAVRQQDSLLSNHPLDYSLHLVGKFDTDTGEIFSCEKQCILPDMLSLMTSNHSASQTDIED